MNYKFYTMKKIKFLKEHLDNNINDVQEVTVERANYLVGCGVAEYHIEKKKK